MLFFQPFDLFKVVSGGFGKSLFEQQDVMFFIRVAVEFLGKPVQAPVSISIEDLVLYRSAG